MTEANLSRILEVSRTPIREALLRLESEGVLSSALAKGFFVRPLSQDEAKELYPILAALEALALRSMESFPEATLDELSTTMKELSESMDPIRRWQLDSQWHNQLVSASQNHKLIEMTRSLRTNLARYELTYMQEITHRDDVDDQHRKILNALRQQDSDKAATLIEDHWKQGQHVILRWLTEQQT